jgi:hypothetical protein
MKNKRMVLLPNDKSQQKKIVNEIRLLIACSLIRLIFDFIYYVAKPTFSTILNEKRSDCLHDISAQSYFFTIGFLLFGSLFCHHVPIAIVTNIFQPINDPTSLLDQNSSFGEQA